MILWYHNCLFIKKLSFIWFGNRGKAENYAIHIAEDDGEIDWDFPCLDHRETVGKFGFKFLALVESKGIFGSHFQEEEK